MLDIDEMVERLLNLMADAFMFWMTLIGLLLFVVGPIVGAIYGVLWLLQ